MGGCLSSSELDKDAKYIHDNHDTSLAAEQMESNNGNPSKGQETNFPAFGVSNTHEVLKFLGQGVEAEAWLMKEKSSGDLVAVKLIPKPLTAGQIEAIRLETKIQVWMGRGCVNVVPAKGVLVSKTHVGIVLEYEAGGNMAGYVNNRIPLGGGMCMDEEEGRFFFTQLINAMDYCHKHKIAHRDLKLDNILLDGHNPPWIKLCDFGFSKPLHEDSSHRRMRFQSMRVGTPDYMGPEVIKDEAPGSGYDGVKADVWSLGVMLYVMLSGQFPFDTSSTAQTEEQLTYEIWLKQHETHWRNINTNADAVRCFSHELKDMLDKMFELDPDKRLDSEGVKAHPWMKLPLPSKYQKPLEEIMAAQQKLQAAGDCGTFDDSRSLNPKNAAFFKALREQALAHEDMEDVVFLDFRGLVIANL